MTISPIGASSVSSLLLSKLLGTSSSSGTEDYSSLTQSTVDSLFLSPEAQWMSRGQEGNPFKADFDNLGSLIQSGDLEGAKKAYASMLEKMQSRQDGQDPMATAFTAIGTALESGDATAAKSAWGTMQASLASMGDGNHGSNPMQRDMDKLSSLIASGDLTSASTLFESIQGKFKAGAPSEAGTSTSGQSGSLDTKFSTLEAALKSGDTDAAKTALAELQDGLKKAPPPPPPSGDQASSGMSDLDLLLLSGYWNYPGSNGTTSGQV